MANDVMMRLWLCYFKKVFISQRHILNRSKDVTFVKYFKIIQLGRRKQKTLADKMRLKKSLLKPVDDHFKTRYTFLSCCVITEFSILRACLSISACLSCLVYSPIKLSFMGGKCHQQSFPVSFQFSVHLPHTLPPFPPSFLVLVLEISPSLSCTRLWLCD